MSYSTPKVPTLASPKRIQAVIQAIQLLLDSELSWLEYSFGVAIHSEKSMGGKSIKYPSVYQGTSEYLNVLPNDNLKSYCFWVLDDPETFEEVRPNANGYYCPTVIASLIVYYDMRRINSTKDYDLTDELIDDVVNVLIRKTYKVNKIGLITVNKVYKKIENVFEGFTIDNVTEQLRGYPFAGFRIECEIKYREQCHA